VQYYDEEHSLTVKKLAMIDSEANHTSLPVKEILLDTLKQFNISEEQVFACVVHNASNMTRTVQLLNEEDEQYVGEKEELDKL